MAFLKSFDIKWWEEIKDTYEVPEGYLNEGLNKPVENMIYMPEFRTTSVESYNTGDVKDFTKDVKGLLTEAEYLTEPDNTNSMNNLPPISETLSQVNSSDVSSTLDLLEQLEKYVIDLGCEGYSTES